MARKDLDKRQFDEGSHFVTQLTACQHRIYAFILTLVPNWSDADDLMHANVGITFDLDAIRASLTASRIKGFTSTCGINNNVQKTETPDAIFYVLVDGQVRVYEEVALPGQLAVDIHIDLREHERFLTLVCVAGTKNYGDWTLFGTPALELEGVEE
jgi:hypothetical protein